MRATQCPLRRRRFSRRSPWPTPWCREGPSEPLGFARPWPRWAGARPGWAPTRRAPEAGARLRAVAASTAAVADRRRRARRSLASLLRVGRRDGDGVDNRLRACRPPMRPPSLGLPAAMATVFWEQSLPGGGSTSSMVETSSRGPQTGRPGKNDRPRRQDPGRDAPRGAEDPAGCRTPSPPRHPTGDATRLVLHRWRWATSKARPSSTSSFFPGTGSARLDIAKRPQIFPPLPPPPPTPSTPSTNSIALVSALAGIFTTRLWPRARRDTS